MLRFGGEDDTAAIDPKVNTNVVGGDPIAAADLGLRNINRVVPMLIPATTKLGGSYQQLHEMWDALVTQRHRELNAVAKIIGGVEETRYQARRGTVPFKPVPADRQRAAVKFLLNHGFATPRAMLDPEVLQRVAQTGATDGLQDSNQKLLQRLVEAGVFQRMAEAQALNPNAKGYTGLDMLYDLNDGLFSELASATPAIELYRRELQRAYVNLLVQRVEGPPSEFRAALRLGAGDLVGKINPAIKKAKGATAAHLHDLAIELGRVR
jgi:hypothetical protein